MGERTRVVVMSRAQANCCRLLSTSLCKSTEVHGTGGRESVAFLRRWVLLSTARLQEVVTRSFSLARPSLAALFFVCSQARRGGSRDGARGEAATAPTAICPGVVGGRRYYEEGSHGAQVAFFFLDPRALRRLLWKRVVAAARRGWVWTSGAPTGPFRCLGLFVR